MVFMTGVILFQPALTKLIVTTGQDSGLPFSSDLACQLLFNFWLRFQVSYPLINPLPDELFSVEATFSLYMN